MKHALKWWHIVLALAGVGGGIAYRNRRRLIAGLLKLPAPQHKVQRFPDLRISMPDDVVLAADLYRPNGVETAPTVLIRTPYGRKSLNQFIASLFAERGFNVVCQDTRGRFGSEGAFEPYVNEAADGEATLAWIAEQSWSNGRIGMWGQSYLGYVQWAAAVTESPHLHAMLPAITQSNLGGPDEQGFMWLDRTLRWLLLLDAMMDTSLWAWQKFSLSYYALAQNRRLERGWHHLPLATADEAVLERPESFYQTWAAQYQPEAPYWQAVDFRAKVPQVSVPMHLVAGWYDIFLQGQLADYAAQRAAGHNPYLTIGPWTHMDQQGMASAVREGITWYEAKLKGNEQVLRSFPVRLYLQGANQWLDYESWPPPAQQASFYLQAKGNLPRISPSLGHRQTVIATIQPTLHRTLAGRCSLLRLVQLITAA